MPTDSGESVGTYSWDKTTIVIVEVAAGAKVGLGYTYADLATAKLIQEMLLNVVQGQDAMHVPACWLDMVKSIRNLGRPGIASMAIAAVDAALWDLKARLLDVALVTLLGAVREAAPIYGSGGFTSYSREHLQRQLGDWVADGMSRVKMKIGRHPDNDPARVADAREAIGPGAELFVDAHPYAWDEIGFGGPAYPRGYMRLEGGKAEPWKVEEQRYKWKAPSASLSDLYKPIGGPGGHKQQTPGQEGTH